MKVIYKLSNFGDKMSSSINAEIKNGVIYPEGKLDIEDQKIKITIHTLPKKLKINAPAELIDELAKYDLEELI
ncbi:MAG: hypothetical protein ACE5J9_02035 [Methanosarcinales archaeon]